MKLPRRENIRRVGHDDPLPYYYRPGTRWAFRRRLEIGLELLGPARFGRLLEVGYGSGIWLPELTERAAAVFGVDVHRRGAWVREMMEEEGGRLFLTTGSVRGLPFQDGAFDAVVCMSVLEHVLPIEDAISELARVARPDGTVVIGVPRTGRLMNGLIRLLGHHDIEEDHVGDAATILAAAAAALAVEETCTFPKWLPPASALYTVCRARKR